MGLTIEEKAIKEISKELGISQSLVQKIVKSQFEFVRVTMEKGEFETVKLPFLGKFHVKPYRLQKLNENYGIIYHRRKSSNTETGTETSTSIQENNITG